MRNNEKTIPLTPRLRAAADWVPSGARLCDVGTDHAFLPAALVLEGRIPSAIASDIRPGPLERAQATLARYGLTDRVQTRLCPGLEAIRPGEADAVSICGMGGEMILHILEAAPWTREGVRLILQPQRSQPELRRWLWDHGCRIEAEKVICEGPRWYTLLLAEGGAQTLPPDPLAERTGHPLLWERQPERVEYLRFLRGKNEALLERLSRSEREGERRAALLEENRLLTDWIERLERGEWPK